MSDELNKEHELYKASLLAFFKNESDNDKLILGLSVAGIGFFISLIKDLDEISEIMFISSIMALVMFFITGILIMLVFYYNRKQLLKIMENTGNADETPELTVLDKVKYIPFSIAVITSAIFAVALFFNQVNRNTDMTDKRNTFRDGISNVAKVNKNNSSDRGVSEVSKVNKNPSQPANSRPAEPNKNPPQPVKK
ncbi:MAG: hypothetical protein A6F72_04720 [Cycloclasticus sp. symbiont of Poecilosclerida sp. N]|nr:MAG: hypothetical protein A6F72_04720 [Cycloclasticus sp. symbiont of Poecilosclerida sp. N]